MDVDKRFKIPTYPDYSLDEEGNVYSNKYSKERKLKLTEDTSGYLTVCLFNSGKGLTQRVHQLMALVFLNHSPCGYSIVVDHINNIQLDNRLSNLQIITREENLTKDKVLKPRVYLYKRSGKWASEIAFNKKTKHLGYFVNKDDAIEAWEYARDRIAAGETNGNNLRK